LWKIPEERSWVNNFGIFGLELIRLRGLEGQQIREESGL
jgi:hypothetical protein